VVPLGGLHGERDRAEFGSAAERYDRYRPGHPSALIDELMSCPTRALDVGRRTGKVALSLTGARTTRPRGRAGRSHGRVKPASLHRQRPAAGRTEEC
jgi:hypothetical protein